MKKFTKEETKTAMKKAMKLRKVYSRKLSCKFNEVSLSICLKEAYEIIVRERKVKSVVTTMSTVFDQNDISAYKNGWKYMFEICEELNYNIVPTGTERMTHRINCSKSDLDTIKEMIKEM